MKAHPVRLACKYVEQKVLARKKQETIHPKHYTLLTSAFFRFMFLAIFFPIS